MILLYKNSLDSWDVHRKTWHVLQLEIDLQEKKKEKRQQFKNFSLTIAARCSSFICLQVMASSQSCECKDNNLKCRKAENFLSSPSCQRLTNSEFALKTCRRREEAANNNIREVHMRLLHHCVQFSIYSLLLPLSLSSVLSLNFCLNTCRGPGTIPGKSTACYVLCLKILSCVDEALSPQYSRRICFWSHL